MFCMNAYTLVGPTKRYPCNFNCFANASASGVDVGRSARDLGAGVRVNSLDFASSARLGDVTSSRERSPQSPGSCRGYG